MRFEDGTHATIRINSHVTSARLLYESFAVLLNSGDTELVKHAVELYRECFVSKGMFENPIYPGIPIRSRTEDSALSTVRRNLQSPRYLPEIVEPFGIAAIFFEISMEANSMAAEPTRATLSLTSWNRNRLSRPRP